ncbi:MAG: Ig-like domain-containing protein [Bacteroidota bacterium]
MNRFSLVLLLCVIFSSSVHSQQWKVQKQGIPEVQYATENQFGDAMAADPSGNFVVVGAPQEDTGELNSGAAYIYQRINGEFELIKKLTPSDPSEDKQFGRAVAIDNNIIVVGAHADKEGAWYSGAAYVYVKGKQGWLDALEMKKLMPHDPVKFGQFGYSVTVEGNTIAIGYPGAIDKHGKKTGAACVYSVIEKSIVYKGLLTLSTPTFLNLDENGLGKVVIIHENSIIASAPLYDRNTFDDGAIFIFNKPKGGWRDATESNILHLSDTVDNAELGKGLYIRGNLLLAGARGPWSAIGNAYLFQRDSTGWNKHPIATLKTSFSSGLPNSYSTAIEDDYILFSAPTIYYQRTQQTSGGVFIYNRPENGWEDMSEDHLIKVDPVRSSYFGKSVLALGDTILIGAPKDNRPSLAAGSVFQLVKSEGGWKQENMTHWETPREENASNYTFGDEVAIYGNTMVVGAPKDNTTGAAYVYEKKGGGWNKVAKLTAQVGRDKDYFGKAVNIYEDCIVVGAPYYDDERGSDVGAAYLFEKPKAGWKDMHETAKLVTSDTSSRLGHSIDLSDSFVAVGCDSRFNKGGTYIFEKTKSGWISKTEDVRIHDYFNAKFFPIGVTLDCNQTGVLASIPTALNKAYFFEKKNGKWDLNNPAEFQLPNIEFAHAVAKAFHISVSLSKDIAVIGWPYAIRENTWGVGEVYIYRKIGGQWQTEPYVLKPPRLKGSGFFGGEVDISDDLLIVGASGGYSNDPERRQSGEAFVYARDGGEWHLIEEVTATHPTQGDRFGHSVGISGTDFVVGAPDDANETGYQAGSAYIFNRYGPWIEKVSSTLPDGCYGIGQDILIDIQYDSVVNVTGSPTLSLFLDKGKAQANYQSGSGTNTLTFKYTVQEGHHSTDLGYNGIFALKGDLKGEDQVNASKLLPSPGRRNSLKGNKNLKIDGKRPLVRDSTFIIDSINQHVTIYWYSDEPIHQFDSTLVEVSNGQLLSIERIDSTEFITYIQPYHGDVTAAIQEGVVKDKALNNALEVEKSFRCNDTVAPTINLTASTLFFSDTVTPISLVLTMSEPVKGFSEEDIRVQNGFTQKLITTDSVTFIAEIVALNEGKIRAGILKDGVVDQAGNTIQNDSFITLVYDVTSPSVQITSPEKDTTTLQSFPITITFSEKVTGFETADLVISNATLTTLVTQDSISFDGEVNTAEMGSIQIEVPAAIAYDQVRLTNTAASPFAIEYQLTETHSESEEKEEPLTASLATGLDTVQAEFIVTVVFSQEVTDLKMSYFTVVNGQIISIETSDSTSFDLLVMPNEVGNVQVGLVEFQVQADPLAVYFKKEEEVITGIINDQEDSKLKLYPIPTEDAITIESSLLQNGNFIIKIMTMDGKVLSQRQYSQPTQKQLLDLSYFTPGHYLIIVSSERRMVSQEIIKK